MAQFVKPICSAYIASKPNRWPSAGKYRHLINAWLKHVGNKPPTRTTVKTFRNACRSAGQSAATYENPLRDLRTACPHAGIKLDIGTPDATPTPEPTPAAIDTIAAIHPHCSAWIRVWIPLAYWTCLRLRDSLDLLRQIDPAADCLQWTAHKTGRKHT